MDTIKICAKSTKMIAHRGLCGIERENSCAAFIAAGNRSFYGIETDVHLTRDGQFVIIHDENTERVSGGAFCVDVEQSDAAALSSVVLTDPVSGKARRDLVLPMLADYVSICKKYDKECVLEVKNPFPQEALARLVEAIDAQGYLSHVVFISFSWSNCVALRALLPDARIQWLTDKEITDDMIASLVSYRFDLDVYFERLSADAVERLHAAGILVNCWTVDNKDAAERLVNMGVDMITTDILEAQA